MNKDKEKTNTAKKDIRNRKKFIVRLATVLFLSILTLLVIFFVRTTHISSQPCYQEGTSILERSGSGAIDIIVYPEIVSSRKEQEIFISASFLGEPGHIDMLVDGANIALTEYGGLWAAQTIVFSDENIEVEVSAFIDGHREIARTVIPVYRGSLPITPADSEGVEYFESEQIVNNRIIVEFHCSVDEQTIVRITERLNGEVIGKLSANTWQIETPPAMSVLTLRSRIFLYELHPQVLRAEKITYGTISPFIIDRSQH